MIFDEIDSGQSFLINIEALFKAYKTISGSIPLSNLKEASVYIECLFDDFLIDVGLNIADSKKIFFVFEVTPESKPPNIPPKHNGSPSEQIMISSSLRDISFPSRVLNFVFEGRFLTSILVILSKSKACKGCPISCKT